MVNLGVNYLGDFVFWFSVNDYGDGDQREFDLETRVTTNGNNKTPRCFTGKQIQPGLTVQTNCPVGSCNIHGDTVPMSGWSVLLDRLPPDSIHW